MPEYFWDEDKNNLLKQTRADITHPNQLRYPKQRILVVKINNYVCVVPYVPSKDSWFLKTIYPNRKYNKKYLKKETI